MHKVAEQLRGRGLEGKGGLEGWSFGRPLEFGDYRPLTGEMEWRESWFCHLQHPEKRPQKGGGCGLVRWPGSGQGWGVLGRPFSGQDRRSEGLEY